MEVQKRRGEEGGHEPVNRGKGVEWRGKKSVTATETERERDRETETNGSRQGDRPGAGGRGHESNPHIYPSNKAPMLVGYLCTIWQRIRPETTTWVIW